jgi:hypothetical protein
VLKRYKLKRKSLDNIKCLFSIRNEHSFSSSGLQKCGRKERQGRSIMHPLCVIKALLIQATVNTTIRTFIICAHPQISRGRSNQGEWGGRGMWHAWERKEKCTWFWWESPKERENSRKPRRRWEDGIIMALRMAGEWIQVALDWWALVNTVMNLRALAPQDSAAY